MKVFDFDDLVRIELSYAEAEKLWNLLSFSYVLKEDFVNDIGIYEKFTNSFLDKLDELLIS